MMGLNGIEYFILFSYELKYELIFALSLFATTQKRMPEEKINGMTVRLLKEERCKKTEVYNREGDGCAHPTMPPSRLKQRTGLPGNSPTARAGCTKGC